MSSSTLNKGREADIASTASSDPGADVEAAAAPARTVHERTPLRPLRRSRPVKQERTCIFGAVLQVTVVVAVIVALLYMIYGQIMHFMGPAMR
eukprot:CAMPEP_0175669072 /NCGR_PEP_ID=MMETSP0097-20121207/18948_1 /TAXON_ID=311494 /ORGANISM="Alexandrium monilatum, Strain CCMP3105" /LENGTH=92 /DNA_ID=CAMNT_0016975589 /DNA_START=6 /DNA_END=284 /DNA_ORIENTATION=+